MFGIENQFDVVRATFSDGTNVPRIPPVRLGGGAYWRDANWLARVRLIHAFAQNDIAAARRRPTGYNLLKAEVSYMQKKFRMRVGARASNSPSASSATICLTRTDALVVLATAGVVVPVVRRLASARCWVISPPAPCSVRSASAH